jgi:uncharacterized membrane protein HdeD (DUF308 family)
MSSSEAAGQPLAARPMLHALADSWWLLLLRGLCAILFGALTLIWPGVTLLTFVLLYGAFVLVDGVLAVISAIRGGSPAPRWWLVIVGLLGIVAGVLTFLWPGITGLILLFLIAGWAIAAGIMEIIGAIKLREEIDDEWLLIAGGILSVIFGIVLLVRPGAGALAVAFIIGAYAILHGILLASLSLRLRRHSHAAK